MQFVKHLWISLPKVDQIHVARAIVRKRNQPLTKIPWPYEVLNVSGPEATDVALVLLFEWVRNTDQDVVTRYQFEVLIHGLVTRGYELGANSFLVKPLDFERFVEISQALSGFWLWMDQAPSPPTTPEEKLVSDTEFIRRAIQVAP